MESGVRGEAGGALMGISAYVAVIDCFLLALIVYLEVR
jgi:hypothetical protein